MLLGRTTERARIERLLNDARQGQGGALVIRGEPGVGKTALLRYALDLAEAMTVVKAVGVESELELEYSGLLELCRPLLSGLDGLPQHQADTLRGALGLEDAGTSDRFVVGAATLSLLALVAESRPVLVAIDDAQWVDAASVAALSFAARRLAADSVAVLVGCRADAVAFELGFEQIVVEGLDTTSATRLLEHVAGEPVPAEVAEHLVEATRGNPLGLVELPRLLTPAQLVGAERIDGPIPVGEGIERAYSAAAEHLPDATQDALLVLAVSDSGEADLIAAALVESGGAATLAPAEDAQLVDLIGDRFTFRHPLVRAALVQGARPSALRSAHRRLADALRDGGQAERRAWHLAAAAVGPDADTANALAAAGASARSRGGYEAASEAFERSARLAVDASVRVDRLADAADMAWSAGDSARAGRLVADVLALDPATTLRARLVQLQGRIELQAGTPAVARDLFVEAADLMESVDSGVAAGSLGLAVAACHHGGLMHEGLVLAERLREISSRDGGAADELADYMLGRALRLAGQTKESVSVLERVLESMLESDELGLADLTRASLAAASLERDRVSRELAGRATRVARSLGPMALAQTLTLLAETCVRQGEWQRAGAAANEGLVLARDLGQPNVAAYFLQSLIRIEGARGNEDTCRAYADEALPLMEASSVVVPLMLVNCALGLLDLGLERLEGAVEILRETSQAIAERGMFGRDFLPELDLVEALVRLGQPDEAQAVFASWLARGGHEGSSLVGAAAARCRGLLASDHAMEAAFADALRLHKVTVNPFGEARTQLCFGERLRRSGRRIDARVQLRAALATFEELDATAWIKRTRRELRATGEKLGRRVAASGDELTPQELQVALQVAEGKTNKEAGAALFLSPKTVEFHLARVYRKLDVSSRAELIRRFASEAVPVTT